MRVNVDYYGDIVLGVPGSYLDERVFCPDAPFIDESPFINTLLHNPNHIGCHTIGSSETYFRGTQQIERQVLEICASDILRAEVDGIDGYVASGGTEANLQAVWIYRNRFILEYGAQIDEIALVCSEDTHYSLSKAANIFNLELVQIPVDKFSRKILLESLSKTADELKGRGIRYLIVIVIANMMTTMFGSVDRVEDYTTILESKNLYYSVHVDGAYGGFYYPLIADRADIDFRNSAIGSITLDAHKVLQTPYGTGVFLCRKGLMRYADMAAASYVAGGDCTIVGSRSGASAIAIWMVLCSYGRKGWENKITELQRHAAWFCQQLTEIDIAHFIESGSRDCPEICVTVYH